MGSNVTEINQNTTVFNLTDGLAVTDDVFSDGYYDTRLINYPDSIPTCPLWKVVLKISIYSIFILVAIAGNLLVIFVVIKNKPMRTTTNFYIVNLAISDLMVTVWCSWVYLVDSLTHGWILGEFFCKFNSFAQVASLVSSILSLTLIAFDRFFGIVFSMQAHFIERRARHSLVVVWVLSVLVAAPLLHTRRVDERVWKDYTERWCDGKWPLEPYGVDIQRNVTLLYRPARVAYWTFLSLVLFIIPIIIMFAAYCGIIKTLWLARAPGERLKREIRVQTKMKRKVIIMLLLILAIFTVCWFPLQIAILYAEYRPDQIGKMGGWYADYEFFARTLAFSNSAINPLIYAGFNDNFRQGIGNMFGCRKKQRWTLARIDSFRSTTTTMTTKVF